MPATPNSRASRQREASDATAEHRAILARRLDMLAGCELQHGHHVAAERLAQQAAELRGIAR